MVIRPEAWSLGLGLLLAGCDRCHEYAKPIHWSGEVVYPEYTSGQIQLAAMEDSSERCSGDCIMGRTPGLIVGRTTLERPGPFELSFGVRGVEGLSPHNVSLLAYVSDDPVTFRDCTAGGMLNLPPSDAINLSLWLKPNQCIELL